MTRLLGLLAIGWLAVALWLHAGVTAETPVVVLVADPLVVSLPQAPSRSRVVTELESAIDTAAATEANSRIRDALLRTSEEEAMLLSIATSPVEMFGSGDAVATATPIYDISLAPDQVTIVVATIELIPGYGATAVSHDHEDGHALINAAVARRCAADVVAASLAAGYRGVRLTEAISNGLADAGSSVHEEYHQLVRYATYGEHIRYAEQALETVAGCG